MGNDLRGIRDRTYRDLIETAVAQGWTAVIRGGHLKLDPPPGIGGGSVWAATTSKGGRGDRNLRALLRKRGVKC